MRRDSIVAPLLLLAMCIAQPANAEKADAAFEAMLLKCPGAARFILEGHPDSASFEAAKRAEAAKSRTKPSPPTHPQLHATLMEMEREDQSARSGDIRDKATGEHILSVDAENLPRIKQMVAEYGFPAVEMVGQDGFNAAWLLVQHADRDPAFQQEMLELLAPKHKIEGQQLALLTDRVLRAQNKPQRYGSQMMEENGHQVPQPIEEPVAKLDERRAALGLMPFADYQCVIEAMYPPRNP